MNRILWPLKVRRIPVAAGLIAAFGSVWLTCKDQLYLSNSYGNVIWQYVVPGFLKTRNGPNLPEKQPKYHSSRKRPNLAIRGNEKLVPVNIGVVSHYETNCLASNEPMEDRNSEYILSKGILFSVFDGHSGWQCAEEVMERLPYYAALSMSHTPELTPVYPKKLAGEVKIISENILFRNDNISGKIFGEKAKEFCGNVKGLPGKKTSIETQLMDAYKLLDQDIVHEAMPEVNDFDPEKVLKGLSGACAITAYVQDRDLYVASSGDCRAVLGSKGSDGKWHATPLSVDQNAFNVKEVERLKREHPGENHVITNGRLLGHLQPLRAFGDVIFKWDSRLHEKFLNKVYGRVVVPQEIYLTPPYLTAEPIVTRHSLQPRDKFLVIATDGLWDMLSNDAAVQCIGELLEGGSVTADDEETEDFQINGASLLIQEALGGDNELKVSRMLSAPKHMRRALRDDITVTVVYFGQGN